MFPTIQGEPHGKHTGSQSLLILEILVKLVILLPNSQRCFEFIGTEINLVKHSLFY